MKFLRSFKYFAGRGMNMSRKKDVFWELDKTYAFSDTAASAKKDIYLSEFNPLSIT
jgi:hypothetical protein